MLFRSYTCVAYKCRKTKTSSRFYTINVFIFNLPQSIYEANEYAQEYLKSLEDEKYVYLYKHFYGGEVINVSNEILNDKK